jgi:hypothetical protein
MNKHEEKIIIIVKTFKKKVHENDLTIINSLTIP